MLGSSRESAVPFLVAVRVPALILLYLFPQRPPLSAYANSSVNPWDSLRFFVRLNPSVNDKSPTLRACIYPVSVVEKRQKFYIRSMDSALAQEIKRTVSAVFPELLDEAFFRNEKVAPLAQETQANASSCTACALHIGRRNSVLGQGVAKSGVAFVGDIPSAHDDESGKIFSDESGALLDKMIIAMNLRPESVYKTNLVKCRPPQDRTPKEIEVHTCRMFLDPELQMPEIRYIVALGETAGRFFARSDASIAHLRGQWHEFEDKLVMITHHPRVLLRESAKKKDAWDDLKLVIKKLQE